MIVLFGKGGLCEIFGGELWRNNRAIGMFSRLGKDTATVIRDGKNLHGLKIDTSTEKVATRIYPFGKDKNGTARGLSYFDNTKPDNIDSAYIGYYPFPRAISFMVDGADMTQSGVTAAIAADLMLDAANAKYNEDHIDLPEITVDVNFELIEYLDEYEAVKELERVFLGDSVRVISERLGVDMQVRVNSYVFDCLAKRYKKLSMESNMRREGLLGTFERYIADSLAGG